MCLGDPEHGVTLDVIMVRLENNNSPNHDTVFPELLHSRGPRTCSGRNGGLRLEVGALKIAARMIRRMQRRLWKV
jgi:hypothetical protein